ncbi:MAG: MBOAT family protein [Vicinamibacterales bacterium]
MNFVSWPFAALFLAVMLARLTVGRRKIEPAFVWVLIVASAVFYAWHVPAYLLLLLTSAVVDFAAARLLAQSAARDRGRRRAILVTSLAVNLGLLAAFKYGNFLLTATGDLASALGLPVNLPVLALVLPIGLSFYTFQSMSYTIDVYRGVLAPAPDFKRFFLFIAFFPQLVAGPIVRASEFLPQLQRPRRLQAGMFLEGCWLILAGYFLKVVCADNLGLFVNAHWNEAYSPESNATLALVTALAFSGQIFADFAGYSSIARGLAYLLGYRLPINFNAPYIAASLRGFWRRWHITLSTWLRDYLYLPLGGNRGSRRRTYVNLLAVMVLGGLWHGAAYTFIAWGALHGAALALERWLGFHRDDGRWSFRAVGLVWPVVTQVVVLVAWIFFRSETITGAFAFAANLFTFDFGPPPPGALTAALFLLPLAGLHAWAWMEERRLMAAPSRGVRAVLAGAMICGLLVVPGDTSDFIYFQF